MTEETLICRTFPFKVPANRNPAVNLPKKIDLQLMRYEAVGTDESNRLTIVKTVNYLVWK